LVAEDSSVTQDLLKLVLSQRGHRVEIVDDGEEALVALCAAEFDVALLDFHLPGLNGLQVVNAFLDSPPHLTLPHFVAITGDVEGLLASPDDCECFDKIVPKPLNVSVVCEVVDEVGGRVERVPGALPPRPNAKSPAAVPAPRRRSPIENLNYNFLVWPDDFQSRGVTTRLAGNAGHDAIVVSTPISPAEASRLWDVRGAHLLPVIDLAGSLGDSADLDGSALSFGETEPVVRLIGTFLNQMSTVHRDLMASDDVDDRLLARIHVSGGVLWPRFDGGAEGLIRYNTVLDDTQARRSAIKLTEKGLLKPEFFARVHECANCSSSRFNVQEVCPDCGSAELEDESYLHHFRCACQGPESDFRHGDDLICPKCRRELRHFGHDYDRPGVMVKCKSCGGATSEPQVGFDCLDCGTRYDGEAVRTRDVHAYRLTDEGAGYVEAGRSFLGFAQRRLRYADLPLDLVVALNAAAGVYTATGQGFALVNIGYEREREIVREQGARQFEQIRSLFLETLRQELSPSASVAKGQAYDFVLLRDAEPTAAEALMREKIGKAAAHLRDDPGAISTIFGPEDLA